MAFPDGWNYRLPITIDHNDIDADLTNWTLVFDQAFASVLTSVDGPLDADGTRPSLNGGGDVRFSSDSAGTTRLACDIRSWVTNNTPANATCVAAVKVPSVSSSSNTTIYMWWGKSGETQPSASDTYGQYNAYDSNYIFVSPNGAGTDDRTSSPATFTAQGSVSAGGITGKVGTATDYDGDDDHTDIATAPSKLNLNGEHVTVELIAYADEAGDQYQRIIDKSDGGGSVNGWGVTFYTAAPSSSSRGVRFYANNVISVGTSGTSSIKPSEWAHYAIVHDHNATTDSAAYVNGSAMSVSTIAATIPSATTGITIGSWNHTTGREYNGRMDELRVSNAIRSAAWVAANWHNQLNTSGFLTWGSITYVGGSPVTVTPSESASIGAVTAPTFVAGSLSLDLSGYSSIAIGVVDAPSLSLGSVTVDMGSSQSIAIGITRIVFGAGASVGRGMLMVWLLPATS